MLEPDGSRSSSVQESEVRGHDAQPRLGSAPRSKGIPGAIEDLRLGHVPLEDLRLSFGELPCRSILSPIERRPPAFLPEPKAYGGDRDQDKAVHVSRAASRFARASAIERSCSVSIGQ